MKTFIGKVIGLKMEKTVVISVKNKRKHPLYQKVMTTHNKFKVHNDKLKLKIGDEVKFFETRPISKDKKWQVLEIIK